MRKMQAFLILEDGTVFEGTHIGAQKEIISEIVFNTAMVGYPEVLTDSSYVGQAVCMTYPLIGNYGVSRSDVEGAKTWLSGLIVRELSRTASNFRTDMTIQEFLEEMGVPGIAGIDTRALTRLLRTKGTMNGMITTNADYKLEEILPRLKEYKIIHAVEETTCREKYEVKGVKTLEENGVIAGSAKFNKADYEAGVRERKPSRIKTLNGIGKKVALLDLGEKESMVKSLVSRGCDVTVYPAQTKAEEILADAPDGILISNGPGDPKQCPSVIEEIKKIYDTELPIFGICLGHQLMALATGADTCKMKYGHRGGNHPVKDLETGKVYITAQTHGYMVDAASVDAKVAAPAFVNVNDGTNEGLVYAGKNIFTVQFHPEPGAGPQDSGYLFDRFIESMSASQ